MPPAPENAPSQASPPVGPPYNVPPRRLPSAPRYSRLWRPIAGRLLVFGMLATALIYRHMFYQCNIKVNDIKCYSL